MSCCIHHPALPVLQATGAHDRTTNTLMQNNVECVHQARSMRPHNTNTVIHMTVASYYKSTTGAASAAPYLIMYLITGTGGNTGMVQAPTTALTRAVNQSHKRSCLQLIDPILAENRYRNSVAISSCTEVQYQTNRYPRNALRRPIPT